MTAPINARQSLQVPNYSGVNIQIFNPAVNTSGTGVTPPVTNTYNNIPTYPANYYTNNYGQQPQVAEKPAATSEPAKTAETKTDAKTDKKTEKRDVVTLTDDYIKNLESYLNSQNTDIRVQGGNEVIARLKEDDSRKSDPALNALVNKMLQDPSQKVRLIGMSALQGDLANGNNETVQILKNMQKQQTGYGEDSLDASNLLLKLAANGNKVQKEFEVKDNSNKNNDKINEMADNLQTLVKNSKNNGTKASDNKKPETKQTNETEQKK